ncbi:MAG TPA: metallophosphoesterase [Lamprocystis sp. (in: g-proteobacteria)]|nr:metallophosphoesterase [Lamprocystis sp. (in: g-proteobacteria)]
MNAKKKGGRGRLQRWIGALGHLMMLGLCLAIGPSAAQDTTAAPGQPGSDRSPPLRFFVVGDLPYGPAEVGPLRALLADAAAQRPPFIIHLGDIKGGSTPCTDANLEEVAALFSTLAVPVAYTPGDNEWTDCHRAGAGGHDPRVRLARVREVFFGDPGVLRLGALGAVHAGGGFPEVYRFLSDGVLFVALHIVGSNNGFSDRDPGTATEFAARDAVNQAFLKQALATAKVRDARALVLFLQADPLFDRGPGPPGFHGFKAQLTDLMDRFPGPVLVLHGDTHVFRHDHPLLDPNRGVPFERLARVEVPGSPIVGGVWITVDLQAPEPFTVSAVYAASLDTLGSE